jgi:hypothetical protein
VKSIVQWNWRAATTSAPGIRAGGGWQESAWKAGRGSAFLYVSAACKHRLKVRLRTLPDPKAKHIIPVIAQSSKAFHILLTRSFPLLKTTRHDFED